MDELPSRSQPVNPSHVTLNGLSHYYPIMHQQTIAYKVMHRPHSITWTTHTEESTTLLEATRLQEALLYTALHYTYMCNIVTEFYLYSIVYIYLINSRLDVTTSVRHHFRTIQELYQSKNMEFVYFWKLCQMVLEHWNGVSLHIGGKID